MIREWEKEENAFQYEEKEGVLTILQWKGSGIAAQIPEEIAGKPVAAIARKAFLSNKRLQEISLPDSIGEIGDWAFAYCGRLTSISLPRRRIRFGKSPFLQCEKLEQIRLSVQGDEAASGEDMTCAGFLLAAAVHKLDAPYLLDPLEAGTAHWLEKWDTRLLQILHTPDRDGYSKTILCGEEDYGSMENNLEYFLSQKRRSKVRLALLRLLYDRGLSQDMRQMLTTYLTAHTKGCQYEETWQVVKEEYGTRKEYYDLLLDIQALTEQNFDAVLRDMGTELAEMKAYLLRAKEERFGNGSFFDSLTL